MNELKNYEHGLITNLLNPCREEIVKEKFQQLGEIKKIKHTNKHKIFDFIMKERKILIEVTSTNLIFPYKNNNPKQRIIRALKHILSKEKYDKFRVIGIIFIDLVHAELMKLFKYVPSNILKIYEIDCLVLVCEKSYKDLLNTKIYFNSNFTEQEKKEIKVILNGI